MTEQQNNQDPAFAGFRWRVLAGTIDSLITLPFFIILIYLFGVNEHMTIQIDEYFYSYSQIEAAGKNNKMIDIAFKVILGLYSIFFVASKFQGTPGKLICGLYVGAKDGKKLTALRATARFFASILSLLVLGIGLIMIAFTKEKTALHDIICSTRVFKGKAKK